MTPTTITDLDRLLRRAENYRIVRAAAGGAILIVDNRLALFFYPHPGSRGQFDYDGLEVGDYQDKWTGPEKQL